MGQLKIMHGHFYSSIPAVWNYLQEINQEENTSNNLEKTLIVVWYAMNRVVRNIRQIGLHGDGKNKIWRQTSM